LNLQQEEGEAVERPSKTEQKSPSSRPSEVRRQEILTPSPSSLALLPAPRNPGAVFPEAAWPEAVAERGGARGWGLGRGRGVQEL